MTNPNDLIIKAKEDIKTLENLFETWNGEYKCWFNDGIAFQVLKDKLSQIESVNVWIAVSERLPEEYEKVIIYSHDTFSAKLVYDSNGHHFENYLWMELAHYPTHWMPLPHPPIINQV